MGEQILYSIVVPIYGVGKYLNKCVDSLINQSLEEIEIICIDDKSEDDSPKILEKYASSDKRIKLLYNKNKKTVILSTKGRITVINPRYHPIYYISNIKVYIITQ